MHSKENLRLTRKNTIQAATRTPINLSSPNLARLWKRGLLGICIREYLKVPTIRGRARIIQLTPQPNMSRSLL